MWENDASLTSEEPAMNVYILETSEKNTDAIVLAVRIRMNGVEMFTVSRD